MIPNFKVMVRDTVVADVSILNDNEVSVKKYSENPAFQPFCGENQSIDRVYRFLQRRCFNPARPDKMEILSAMGLECFMISHGYYLKAKIILGMILFITQNMEYGKTTLHRSIL